MRLQFRLCRSPLGQSWEDQGNCPETWGAWIKGLQPQLYGTVVFNHKVQEKVRYLLAVVGGILHAMEVSVGPSIQVSVLSTNVTISSIARFALTAVHDVGENAQVNTVGVFVTVMAPVLTWVPWCTDLEEKSYDFGLLSITDSVSMGLMLRSVPCVLEGNRTGIRQYFYFLQQTRFNLISWL